MSTDNGTATPTPNPNNDMTALLKKYLEWLSVRNYSAKTVKIRLLCCGYFITWAEQRGLSKPSEVTKPVVERYQRFLFNLRKQNGDPLSTRTQVSRLCAVKAWFKWLARYNHIPFNPAGEIDMPRQEHRLPRAVLTEREVELVLDQPDINDPLGLRDRAVMETLYSTGMRRLELIGLKTYDIDAERGTVLIRQGKGKKDRMIPIGERALSWVSRYLLEVRPKLLIGDGGKDVLFLTHFGESFHPEYLTRLIGKYVTAAQVGKKGCCHIFRHTMATLMLEGGADVRFIQAMLGHAKLDTTMIYTQVSIRMLKQVHTATHPARLGKKLDDDDLEDGGIGTPGKVQ